MKATVSCFLLALGLAHAQTFTITRSADTRFEGGYESFQRDRTVHRTLRLNRNGTAELVTEFLRKNDDDPRDGWIRMDRDDERKFGRIAAEAARGRTVRQTGRWTSRDDRVNVRFENRMRTTGRDDDWGRADVDLDLRYRDGGLWFDRDSEAYGTDRIKFKANDDLGGPSRGTDGLGYLLYDRDYLRIDSVDLREGNDARLAVRAEGRRYEFRGETRRRGDEVTFRIPYVGRDGGEFRLRMRGSQVVDVRGSGAYDRHRIDFDKVGRRRD